MTALSAVAIQLCTVIAMDITIAVAEGKIVAKAQPSSSPVSQFRPPLAWQDRRRLSVILYNDQVALLVISIFPLARKQEFTFCLNKHIIYLLASGRVCSPDSFMSFKSNRAKLEQGNAEKGNTQLSRLLGLQIHQSHHSYHIAAGCTTPHNIEIHKYTNKNPAYGRH